MKWFYQIKSYLYENTIYVNSVISVFCLILACHRIFKRKEKSYDLNTDVFRVSETDEILSNNTEEFEILGSDDDSNDID